MFEQTVHFFLRDPLAFSSIFELFCMKYLIFSTCLLNFISKSIRIYFSDLILTQRAQKTIKSSEIKMKSSVVGYFTHVDLFVKILIIT